MSSSLYLQITLFFPLETSLHKRRNLSFFLLCLIFLSTFPFPSSCRISDNISLQDFINQHFFYSLPIFALNWSRFFFHTQWWITSFRNIRERTGSSPLFDLEILPFPVLCHLRSHQLVRRGRTLINNPLYFFLFLPSILKLQKLIEQLFGICSFFFLWLLRF